jgi:menaquinone-dependent protoporphyrinogen oxidase
MNAMINILLAYHSTYGYIRRICETLRAELAGKGLRVDLAPLVGGNADPARYGMIVIGASIRNGKHDPAVLDFIRANQALLQSKPCGVFAGNLDYPRFGTHAKVEFTDWDEVRRYAGRIAALATRRTG